jgi:molybdenum cofactor biosynthesis enzyme MoaA
MSDLDQEFCSAFDEEDYLETYPDVAAAVQLGVITSGLEHYFRHGNSEGRNYRLKSATVRENRASKIADNLKERTARLTVLRSFPTDIVLAVTTACNLRCVMCPHGMGMIRDPAHMPVEYGTKLKEFVSHASRIILSGVGEPTLAPAFWWFIDEVRFPARAYTRVNSNAHFLTPENAAKLVRSNLTEISISLDAASSPTYRKIRGGSFFRAIRGILHLERARSAQGNKAIRIYVNMTLMRENLHEAPNLVRLAYRLGVDGVVFTQLFQFGNTPSWRVSRAGWSFVYSHQFISEVPNEVRSTLSQVISLSKILPMAVHLRDNVAAYLKT